MPGRKCAAIFRERQKECSRMRAFQNVQVFMQPPSYKKCRWKLLNPSIFSDPWWQPASNYSWGRFLIVLRSSRRISANTIISFEGAAPWCLSIWSQRRSSILSAAQNETLARTWLINQWPLFLKPRIEWCHSWERWLDVLVAKDALWALLEMSFRYPQLDGFLLFFAFQPFFQWHQ